ncbi:MAG: protein kinase [Moorea sp. SIO2B7]|nr:protein kinase [Moorena sp. SIO2B7]
MSNHLDFKHYGYQIERELGQNRAGGRITYLAREQKNQLPVVIKQFQFAQSGASWADYDAYEREIQVLQQLDCPSIPRYLDSIETPTGFCLIQEYKEALPLTQIYHFTPQEIKDIAIAVLEVLVYLQQQDPPIIHRDLKPENILVERSTPLKVYLIDFGFARQKSGDAALSSVVKGTLGFMPPEQLFNRQLTKATDLYSLGATLISLLTKTKSSDIGNLIDEKNQINFKQKLPKGLNRQFVKWLEKMVAPNLKHRFHDAEISLEALKNINLFKDTPLKILAPIAAGLAMFGIGAFLGSTWIVSQNNNIEPIDPPPIIEIPPIEIPPNPAVAQLLQTGHCPGCSLRGVNLEKANLVGANLEGADLANANLGGANLHRARLQGANLPYANLNRAILKNADLSGANLKGVNLKNADLWDAHLMGANLNNANLSNAILNEAEFWNANLGDAKLKSTYLQGINLQGATMPDGRKFK